MYAELSRKRCTKCERIKSIDRFQKNDRYKDGHHTWCKDCKLDSQRRHTETNRKWTEKNRARSNEIKIRYVERNALRVRESKRKWYDANPKLRLENCRRYQAKKLNATPAWLSMEQIKEIKAFYLKCPDGHEVDHIVPLRGKDVCGLHVPWNLQHLPKSANRQKSNR